MIPLIENTFGYLILDDSLGFPFYRLTNIGWFPSFPYYGLFNIWWIPFLKIEKFIRFKNVLCFQKIFGTYYQTSISCFFDRYEIHIQAFFDFIKPIFIICRSSSSQNIIQMRYSRQKETIDKKVPNVSNKARNL